MNTESPKISVIMPVYNGEKYLNEAIDSILTQVFYEFELLIIDDGSKDSSKEIIKSYNDTRIRYIDNTKNEGLIFTLNQGLKFARGKYIARMDQDDISLPNRFQKQYDFLEDNSDTILIGGWANVIDQNGDKIRNKKTPLDYTEIKFEILFHNPFIHSAIFFRKDVIKNIGGYSKDYEHAEDFELYSRLIKNNLKILNLPEFLIKFRIHDSSIGQTTRTNTIQKVTVEKIISENTNKYFRINQDMFSTYYNVLNGEDFNLRDFIMYNKVLRNIYKNYIKNESLDKSEIKEINTTYNKKRKEIAKKILLIQMRKIPFLYNLVRYFYRNIHKKRRA